MILQVCRESGVGGPPEDAYRCFMRSEIDDLVLGDLLLEKEQQPARPDDDSWRQEFTLD